MQQWSQWSQSVHFKIIRHPSPFCVPVYIPFVQYIEGGNINILYKARKLCARICSGSFQSESVRRTPASLRRVCIHSKCPLQNYGTSSVFTPSYRPPSWMATMPLPSLPCKHFVKSCHMFMTHQQPGGWVWAHLSQSKLFTILPSLILTNLQILPAVWYLVNIRCNVLIWNMADFDLFIASTVA